jgi:hypothetical protein
MRAMPKQIVLDVHTTTGKPFLRDENGARIDDDFRIPAAAKVWAAHLADYLVRAYQGGYAVGYNAGAAPKLVPTYVKSIDIGTLPPSEDPVWRVPTEIVD